LQAFKEGGPVLRNLLFGIYCQFDHHLVYINLIYFLFL
jgi:hypothetical protein